MSDARRAPISPHELEELLAKLDEVMAEALRLREQVSRQLTDQSRVQQQRLSTPRASDGRAAMTRKRRSRSTGLTRG
jgi:hypothetical protein